MKGAPHERIVAYTAVFGRGDRLMDAPRLRGVRFVCFTDQPDVAAKGWEVVRRPSPDADARRGARWFKVHPHVLFPNHEWSIWMDGTHCLRRDPAALIECAVDGLAAYVHRERDCAYEEAFACVARGFPADVIHDQMQRYARAGYPRHHGLSENSVLVRRHRAPGVVEAMTAWWAEIESGSVRDQLSLQFVLWRLGARWNVLPGGNAYWNTFFHYTPHGQNPGRAHSIAARNVTLSVRPVPFWRALLFVLEHGNAAALRRSYWAFHESRRRAC